MAIETLISAVKAWAENAFPSKANFVDVSMGLKATDTRIEHLDTRIEHLDTRIEHLDTRMSDAVTKSSLVYEVTNEYFWDGTIGSNDTFKYNGASYCKISDFNEPLSSVVSVSSHRADNGYNFSELYDGSGCYRLGGAIVVTQAGECSLKVDVNDDYLIYFDAPSVGMYVFKYTDTNYIKDVKVVTANTVDLVALEARVAELEAKLS